MKCKNCGAPIVSRVCEYCGTEHKEYIEDEYITIPINGRDIKFYKGTIKVDNILQGTLIDVDGRMHKEKIKNVYTLTLISEPV